MLEDTYVVAYPYAYLRGGYCLSLAVAIRLVKSISFVFGSNNIPKLAFEMPCASAQSVYMPSAYCYFGSALCAHCLAIDK